MEVAYYVKDDAGAELKYSLRSIDKHLKPDRVIIVGGKPKWLTGVDHIPTIQDGTKYENALRNQNALLASDLGQSFVMMNDDFFVMKSLSEIPVYNFGTYKWWLTHVLKSRQSRYYFNSLDTRDLLKSLNTKQEPTCYELHVPMQFDKFKLQETFSIIRNYERPNPGIQPRSVYGTVFGLGGEQIQDVKVYGCADMPDTSANFLSCDDKTWESGLIGRYIRQCFPEKSRYEK